MSFLKQYREKSPNELIQLIGHNHRVLVKELRPVEEFAHHQRGIVGGFSKYSKRRLLELFFSFKDSPFKTFWTLTFDKDVKAAYAKKELKRFGMVLARKHICYVWVLEFTKNGRIHFHLALTDFISKKFVSRRWRNGFVYVSAVFEDSGLRSYFVSEVAKGNQKKFHGFNGRWWGVSRSLNQKYNLGVYNENLVHDLVNTVGCKRNFYRDDFEKLGLDLTRVVE